MRNIAMTLTVISLQDKVKSVRQQHEPISGATHFMLLVEASKCVNFFRFPTNCKDNESV
jgi:hypothetical protein